RSVTISPKKEQENQKRPGPGPKVPISTEGGYQSVWSRKGKELSYRAGQGSPKMMPATIVTEPEFWVIESRELFETINFRYYDFAPDGAVPDDPGSTRTRTTWDQHCDQLGRRAETPCAAGQRVRTG
ncbi:MAG: hypothetical protein ACYTDV_21690, partial [Planctomycetota bacterium]